MPINDSDMNPGIQATTDKSNKKKNEKKNDEADVNNNNATLYYGGGGIIMKYVPIEYYEFKIPIMLGYFRMGGRH